MFLLHKDNYRVQKQSTFILDSRRLYENQMWYKNNTIIKNLKNILHGGLSQGKLS